MLVAIATSTLFSVAWAGLVGLGRGAVGGISISADGVVGAPDINARGLLLNELRKSIKSAEPELNRTTSLRMISLRELEVACREALTSGVAGIPEHVRFLAGIQRIQYVFVYPEKNDIVIAGPGEGWMVNESAAVVGVTTGRPVLRLDDLLVALRTVEQSRLGGISCSIDPTEEGIRAFRNVMDQLRKEPNASSEYRARRSSARSAIRR